MESINVRRGAMHSENHPISISRQTAVFLVAALLLPAVISTAAPVTPEENAGKYSFTIGPIFFETDSKVGGRIVSFKWEDKENLWLEKSAEPNWGSTFWPSPQKSWQREWGTQDWPPSEVIDQEEYTGGIEGDKISLKSEYDPWNQFSLTKEFTADDLDSAISVTYIMDTETDTTNPSWAPWEISRMLPNGMIFWPTGPGAVSGPLEYLVEEQDDHTWFYYDTDKIGGGKIFADAKDGWLAHASDDGYLVIKKFPDIDEADFAKDEAEIEVYCDGSRRYWEMEQQGAFKEITKDTPYRWTVKWYLRKLPDDIVVEPGSAELLEYTLKVLEEKTAIHLPTGDIRLENQLLTINPLSPFFSVKLEKTSDVSIHLYALDGRKTGSFQYRSLSKGLHTIKLPIHSDGLVLGQIDIR